VNASPAADPREWFALPVLAGSRVRLEPLAIEHAAGYLAAAGTGADAEEVFRWMFPPAPVTEDDARQHVLDAVAARAAGSRLAYAQIDAATGAFAGTSSYYDIDAGLRAIAIGHTWLGRRWWRTGLNTEAKLLLMSHAFDRLGAVRVVWHTDVYNTRSQDAIARLGATREGLLRKHRIRRDGSWRDTVQYAMTDEDWPAAKEQLRARLVMG
jgi:RimJ/RimL family protein N-acetyltransferase